MRMPPGDLCDDLRVSPREAAQHGLKGGSASNAHLRLYVALWMLSVDDSDDRAALLFAHELYNRYGMLDMPGYLTDAIIAREVMMLLDKENER